MASDRVGRKRNEDIDESNMGTSREHGLNIQKRQARVTVKYNRTELQKRLDVEKWIDEFLDKLYVDREEEMPEVNMDELLDLPTDEERGHQLQVLLQTCSHNTEAFIGELVEKLRGLHKQEQLQNEGIEHPNLHSYPHHHAEPYHFSDPHHRTHHQTL